MKRASIAVAVLVALTLTGCAGNPASSGDDPTAPLATESEAAAPATVAPTDSDEVDVEKYFLETSLVKQLELTDEEKLAAGYYACEQVEAGNLEVVALEGATDVMNSFFVGSATTILCPELAEVYAAG